MISVRAKYLIVPLAALLWLAPFAVQASAEVKATFLYNLSNFHGKIPYSDVRVRVDRDRDEIYVLDRGNIQVFNENGMEIFRFGDDPSLGSVFDLAVDDRGDLLLLSVDFSHPAKRPTYWISWCNHRGEPRERVEISGLTKEYSEFVPDTMFYRDGGFFLVSQNKMQAVVTDKKGNFQKGYDFAQLLEIPVKDRPDTLISGFSLDRAGNMLFTVAVLFQAYVVSPEGKLTASFGKTGSAPGMFGIAGGIVADDLGNYLVVERLRSVVMVFDKGFRFLQEFGYRGDKPGNLIRPRELAIGNSGKLFVTQLMKRGVSVFSVSSN